MTTDKTNNSNPESNPENNTNQINGKNGKKSNKFVWAFSTYFAEGFPYSVVRQISSVFFKDNGASLQAIGLTSLYGLPWVLKFLWAPFVDEFGTKRKWLITAEIFLVAAILLIAFTSALPNPLGIVSVLFLVIAFISATHDISIDGFYLENMDREEQAKYVGFQAMSYRIALVAGGGGIVYFSGITTWWAAFTLAAAIMAGLLVFHSFFLPKTETPRRNPSEMLTYLKKKRIWLTALFLLPSIFILQHLWQQEIRTNPQGILATYLRRVGIPGFIVIILFAALIILAMNLKKLKRKLYSSKSFYALAFIDYLDQPKIAIILSFIVLYRTGESFLLNMLYPFLRDIGITRAEYGVAYGTFGIIASITGGLLGGKLISKFSLKKVIWPLVLSQNVLNLFYMILAYFHQDTLVNRAVLKHNITLNLADFFNQKAGAITELCGNIQALNLDRANVHFVTLMVVLEAFGAGLGTAANE